MPINAHPEYIEAEKRYLVAETDEERLEALKEMISKAPSHKGGENLRAHLKARLKKLKEALEKKSKKTGKKIGIRKEGIQVVLVGLTNSGKSSLISLLTNARPKISSGISQFTTLEPIIGTLEYDGIKFQIIDMPAINHPNFNQGIANTTDICLIIITDIKEIEQITPYLSHSSSKKIIVLNKSDLLTEQEKRRVESTLQSKRYDFVLVSVKTQEGIVELKKKLVQNSGVIRIYTKKPGKPIDSEPIISKPGVSVKEIAEKVFPKFIKIKQVKVTGPSSKFPNQIVGLEHILQDKDVVEFYTC